MCPPQKKGSRKLPPPPIVGGIHPVLAVTPGGGSRRLEDKLPVKEKNLGNFMIGRKKNSTGGWISQVGNLSVSPPNSKIISKTPRIQPSLVILPTNYEWFAAKIFRQHIGGFAANENMFGPWSSIKDACFFRKNLYPLPLSGFSIKDIDVFL